MSLLPRLGAVLGAAVLAAGASLVTASSASAELVPDGVYSVSYSGDLFLVDTAHQEVQQLTYAEWRAMGYPSPQSVRTDWVTYPWSPTIYAKTSFGSEETEKLWDMVTYDEWKRAGFPGAHVTGQVADSEYRRWGTSDELFVVAPDQTVHKMTPQQWRDAGSPMPDTLGNEGYILYSWNPTIVRMSDLAGGHGDAISYAQWRAQDFPTPRVVTRVVGDQVYRIEGSANIWYAGPGLNKVLTSAEWQAMGSPAPTVKPRTGA